MRISDWSSDVCSSDLPISRGVFGTAGAKLQSRLRQPVLDEASRDRIAARQLEGLVLRRVQQLVAAEPAGALQLVGAERGRLVLGAGVKPEHDGGRERPGLRGLVAHLLDRQPEDRKSTRLNSSH